MLESKIWKTWKAIVDLKTCLSCVNNNGKIYSVDEVVQSEPPVHYKCRCIITWLKALIAGTATENGIEGADWHLKHKNKLPDYYISKKEAQMLGYRQYLGNLNSVAPGKMLAKGVYNNLNKRLPIAHDRVWYEADINYTKGYRGSGRILYSNDGLIFVTYDHYLTFYEII